MVSVMKGLSVQKSRFAVLSVEQDSEEEEESAQGKWQQVAPAKPKSAAHKKGSSHGGGQGQGEEGKTLSKSAKKRARKRRNKSASSDHEVCEFLVVDACGLDRILLSQRRD